MSAMPLPASAPITNSDHTKKKTRSSVEALRRARREMLLHENQPLEPLVPSEAEPLASYEATRRSAG